MKRLILLRHADAPRILGHDMERGISTLGEAQAADAAQLLAKYSIDNVLCSNVKRTKQTLEILRLHLSFADDIIEFSNQIYSNSLHTLLSLVSYISDNNETVLLIGHNPSLLELAIYYDPSSEENFEHEFSFGLKPAEAIIIEFPNSTSWGNLRAGNGKLVAYGKSEGASSRSLDTSS